MISGHLAHLAPLSELDRHWLWCYVYILLLHSYCALEQGSDFQSKEDVSLRCEKGPHLDVSGNCFPADYAHLQYPAVHRLGYRGSKTLILHPVSLISRHIYSLIKVMHGYREMISNGKQQVAFLWRDRYSTSGVSWTYHPVVTKGRMTTINIFAAVSHCWPLC